MELVCGIIVVLVISYITWPLKPLSKIKSQIVKVDMPIRSFFKKTQSFISRINVLYLLLTTIAIILFFGLFKNEVKAWQQDTWSKFFEVVDVYGDYSCRKLINNPNYDTDYQKAVEESQRLKTDPVRIAEFEKCVREQTAGSDWMKRVVCGEREPSAAKQVWTTTTCNGVVKKETWLRVLGIRLWTVSSVDVKTT